ncbi:hypothetical protein BH09DEP1_BH09DEP1_4070 [soil metagenome]
MKNRSILSLSMLTLAIMAPAQAMEGKKPKFWTPARVANLYHFGVSPAASFMKIAGLVGIGWSFGFIHGAITAQTANNNDSYKSMYREKNDLLEGIIDKSACTKEYDAWQTNRQLLEKGDISKNAYQEIQNAYFNCRHQFLAPFKPKA